MDKKDGEERGGKKDIGAIGGWCKGKRKRKDNYKRRKRGWRREGDFECKTVVSCRGKSALFMSRGCESQYSMITTCICVNAYE